MKRLVPLIDRPAGTGKKFDVAGPAAPSWRWHVHGSCLTRDLNVPLHARMLFGRPLSDLGDDQAISRVYSLFLGYRVIRPKRELNHTAVVSGLTLGGKDEACPLVLA